MLLSHVNLCEPWIYLHVSILVKRQKGSGKISNTFEFWTFLAVAFWAFFHIFSIFQRFLSVSVLISPPTNFQPHFPGHAWGACCRCLPSAAGASMGSCGPCSGDRTCTLQNKHMYIVYSYVHMIHIISIYKVTYKLYVSIWYIIVLWNMQW